MYQNTLPVCKKPVTRTKKFHVVEAYKNRDRKNLIAKIREIFCFSSLCLYYLQNRKSHSFLSYLQIFPWILIGKN